MKKKSKKKKTKKKLKKKTTKKEVVTNVQDCETPDGQGFTITFAVAKKKKTTIKSLQEEVEYEKKMVQRERESLSELWKEMDALKTKLFKAEEDRNLYRALLETIAFAPKLKVTAKG